MSKCKRELCCGFIGSMSVYDAGNREEIHFLKRCGELRRHNARWRCCIRQSLMAVYSATTPTVDGLCKEELSGSLTY